MPAREPRHHLAIAIAIAIDIAAFVFRAADLGFACQHSPTPLSTEPPPSRANTFAIDLVFILAVHQLFQHLYLLHALSHRLVSLSLVPPSLALRSLPLGSLASVTPARNPLRFELTRTSLRTAFFFAH
ncbi:hypothetical protein EDB83DRAFT_2521251 [Lactarius deliciosus]|nr:hypothetical protein EDB83DRAFT_2521251 [Lactarius deliciosus]